MNFRRHLIAIAAALALAIAPLTPFLQVEQAEAAATVLCAPNPLDQSSMRTIGGTNSAVPSQTLYTLNGQGCTIAQQQDVGWFLSQGFTAGPPFGPNVLYTTGVLTGTTSVQIGTLPPSTYIQHIIVNNLTANAITGGIGIGSAAAGSDIVAPANLACGANCLTFVTDASLAKRIFSTTAPQPIFASANGVSGAWNSANVTITVVYGYF